MANNPALSFPPTLASRNCSIQPLITLVQNSLLAWALGILLMFNFKQQCKLIKSHLGMVTPKTSVICLQLPPFRSSRYLYRFH